MRKHFEMQARIFEGVLHKLPSGKSPAGARVEQLNESPNLQEPEKLYGHHDP